MSGDTWETIRRAERRYRKRRRERLRAAGLCACGRPVLPGRVTCAACAEKNQRAYRENRDKWLAQGLCIICHNKPHRPGKQTCPLCGLKHSDESIRHNNKKKGSIT